MTDTSPAGQTSPEPEMSLNYPHPDYNYGHLISKLQLWRKVIRRSNKRALENQITILIYLYKHDSLTAVKLRSMMKIPAITGFRYMAALTHAGLVKWRGSHKKGAYFITEEGKDFLTNPTYFRGI